MDSKLLLWRSRRFHRDKGTCLEFEILFSKIGETSEVES